MSKTVKVRIAVAVNAEGDWSACGWPNPSAAGDMMGMALDSLDADGAVSEFWITAELPVPETCDVAGAVTQDPRA